VKKERAEYAKRLERGVVTDEEQRDRAMAEQKLIPTELPIMGAIIGKVARFGNLAYFQLRDLERKNRCSATIRGSTRCAIACSTSIRWRAPWRRNSSATITAPRSASPTTSSVLAQSGQGRRALQPHRAALREDRGLEPMEPRNANEAEIIERLANLSSLVDGGQSAQGQGHTLSRQEGAAS